VPSDARARPAASSQERPRAGGRETADFRPPRRAAQERAKAARPGSARRWGGGAPVPGPGGVRRGKRPTRGGEQRVVEAPARSPSRSRRPTPAPRFVAVGLASEPGSGAQRVGRGGEGRGTRLQVTREGRAPPGSVLLCAVGVVGRPVGLGAGWLARGWGKCGGEWAGTAYGRSPEGRQSVAVGCAGRSLGIRRSRGGGSRRVGRGEGRWTAYAGSPRGRQLPAGRPAVAGRPAPRGWRRRWTGGRLLGQNQRGRLASGRATERRGHAASAARHRRTPMAAAAPTQSAAARVQAASAAARHGRLAPPHRASRPRAPSVPRPGIIPAVWSETQRPGAAAWRAMEEEVVCGCTTSRRELPSRRSYHAPPSSYFFSHPSPSLKILPF
jgi:hypothetical protein